MPIVPCHALAVSTAASGRALAPTRGHRHPDAPAPRQTGGVISRTQYLVNALLVLLPFLLAEFEFFNFPSGGLGEIAKLHGLGALKMRHVLTAEGCMPGLGTTKALGTSPQRSSGMATTATSCTAGCW